MMSFRLSAVPTGDVILVGIRLPRFPFLVTGSQLNPNLVGEAGQTMPAGNSGDKRGLASLSIGFRPGT